MANLELSRELYSDNQRKQFYADFQAALNAEKTSFRALKAHWRNGPAWWEFWKRAPSEWKQAERRLVDGYSQACKTLRDLKESYPLLVDVFYRKHQPL
ncbi:hypothetical protein QZH44_29800 (plasmid) [Pseudomonas corrugata]|uniref:hypothetical protein n=1 Tax=Pseudomonas corrugata TaxID=47879 RepID=UPI003D81A116